MFKNKVHVGIIGTGVGLRTHLPAFKRLDNVEVVGLVGSTPERGRYFAEKVGIPKVYSDFRRLCEDPDIDVVCVTTPNLYHFKQVSYALQQDKNVLAEKPLAMTLDETLNLANLAKRSSRITAVNHQLRFNPYIRKIRDLIQTQAIGRPYFIRIHQQGFGWAKLDTKWNWSFEKKMGGGVRLAMGSHLIDLINYWLGNKSIYTVQSTMDVVIPKRKDASGNLRNVDVSSAFNINLSMEDNLSVNLTATAAAFDKFRFDISVYGTDGELQFSIDHKLRGAFRPNIGELKNIDVSGVLLEERENKVSLFRGSFLYFAPRFIDAVISGSTEPIQSAASFNDAVITQRVLDATLKSSLSGDSVKLNYGYTPGAFF